VSKFADNMSLTKLVVSLKDTDPDDAFSSVPYEKGSCFLVYLEQLLGGPEVFEPFFRKYIDTYKYKTCTTDEWKTFLFDYFKDKTNILETVDWEAWLRKPGMPPVNMIERYDSSLADACISLCQKWINASEKELNSFSSQDIASFTSPQKVEFLAQLLAKMATPLRTKWLGRCVPANGGLLVESRKNEVYPSPLRILPIQRSPLTQQHDSNFFFVRELFKCEKSKDLAVTTFKKHRAFYHPICSAMVAKDLGID
ncbi:predicted protein, partial [Nematostella vectensis]